MTHADPNMLDINIKKIVINIIERMHALHTQFNLENLINFACGTKDGKVYSGTHRYANRKSNLSSRSDAIGNRRMKNR